jgi:hypothetical protein
MVNMNAVVIIHLTLENDHCRFVIDPNEYKMIPWSTWNVNSGNLPHLAPAAKGSENVLIKIM